ncbi:NUDIX hydrolase [Rubinisphaera italica]|uniref:GDP-mannose pyrophosphatase n=1 Tax=Rubinisphaera italica TaxID=2527969 RepID=A0A5C5XIX9_9PLAN|nr:NUDIX hydrolase [Rubinisphaera italica]TWT62273.1 ADP-ribose pyrophosphatase [Rubinisphaera italica]
MSKTKILYEGRFLELVAQGKWEYVRRNNSTTTIAILALTQNDDLLFVEQMRLPVGGPVIELPAGLVGDDGDVTEQPIVAAIRELEEETGYTTEKITELGTFCSSAGLTNEQTTMFLAIDCRQIGSGGGVAGESIQIHKIPRKNAASWLLDRVKLGELMDGKVWTALALAQRRKWKVPKN